MPSRRRRPSHIYGTNTSREEPNNPPELAPSPLNQVIATRQWGTIEHAGAFLIVNIIHHGSILMRYRFHMESAGIEQIDSMVTLAYQVGARVWDEDENTALERICEDILTGGLPSCKASRRIIEP